mmetsp:Transcript_17154/g.65473  ORF Transcript_17154/g.65473 Transcript_17154/m.65473 type:complete len:294 (+) Transcript_17154:235-1116(+)|eukprot:scaffold300_cov258-Pinguiococcus_pyrenoidosus.AAC.43
MEQHRLLRGRSESPELRSGSERHHHRLGSPQQSDQPRGRQAAGPGPGAQHLAQASGPAVELDRRRGSAGFGIGHTRQQVRSLRAAGHGEQAERGGTARPPKGRGPDLRWPRSAAAGCRQPWELGEPSGGGESAAADGGAPDRRRGGELVPERRQRESLSATRRAGECRDATHEHDRGPEASAQGAGAHQRRPDRGLGGSPEEREEGEERDQHRADRAEENAGREGAGLQRAHWRAGGGAPQRSAGWDERQQREGSGHLPCGKGRGRAQADPGGRSRRCATGRAGCRSFEGGAL